MNISPTDLAVQYDRAASDWPFIAALEEFHGLPPMLLFAVGSRETDLTDELGDCGHGHGVFQLDDRSHQIPERFPVIEQADVAAGMLLAGYGPGWLAACNRYNSGQASSEGTTGRDYGPDVLERMAWLQLNRRPAESAGVISSLYS